MPGTKKQDLRFEVLDELLAIKKWTLDELLNRVNEKLGDEFNTINKRTLFRDIKYLVEEKSAPIHRPAKGDDLYYYTEKFSLKNIPLDEDDLSSLKNAIQILKQVDNFYLSKEVEDVIRKLENRIHIQSDDQSIIIQFERHTSSLGNEHINNLMDAIRSKSALRISYQPYLYLEPVEKVVHPYLLKEFRNRWFLIGREGNSNRVTNYSLDRIKKIKPASEDFCENNIFDPAEYYKYLIGVSMPENASPESIEIKVYKPAVPYILSKPIHFNQEKIKTYKDGTMLIRLNLVNNYELKSILLGYGVGIEVKKPKSLREEMKKLIKDMNGLYK